MYGTQKSTVLVFFTLCWRELTLAAMDFVGGPGKIQPAVIVAGGAGTLK
jgi:hypothetical protein